MSGAPHGPGGRLALADRAALDDAARELFDNITTSAVAWARRSGFAAATADGHLIGPFNPSLLNPGVSGAFLKLQAAEQHCTSLDERTRQVVILTVGSEWRAPYELYAHSAVARHAGLSESVIAGLVVGTEPEALTDDQRIAHRLARALSTDHRVDDALYEQASQRFGAAGVFDITVLVGIYHTVCGILNAFAVPAPDHPRPSRTTMSLPPLPTVTLTPVAYFPQKYFLENLAVRADGSLLITAVLQRELWWVPPPHPVALIDPVLVHTFDYPVTGIVEVAPEVFVVNLTLGYTTGESHLARMDLTDWAPGRPVNPEIIYTFDERARGLNGSCLLAPGVLAVADCFAGLIWRVDLDPDARHATAHVWLAHDTMAFDPDSGVPPPPQPGVNGVRYGPHTGHLYYTSTAQKVFMRVAVDPSTLNPAGSAEFVAAIDNADDFCLDEDAGFAYVTRHRANTIDRVPLQPRRGSEVRHIAGDPFDDTLVGPSSAAWGRGDGDRGRVAYVTTDGGTTAPPDGVVRRAAVLRLELGYDAAASTAGMNA